jgi:release factor glutamine methyltransferase
MNSDNDSTIEEYGEKGIPLADLDRMTLLSNGNNCALRRMCQRRLFHEPFPYIIGKADFFGRKFSIDRRVYVPNPETEIMVKLVLEEINDDSIVLDVGTGSGCIGITIAKERPSARVFGCDIDPNALFVAEQNARMHNTSIPYFESCYVESVPIKPTHIVADMPYGNENCMLSTNNIHELRHMPPHAYFHPLGILDAYKELIASIQKKGWACTLFFETGRISMEEVRNIIPANLRWRYIPFRDYSVTRLKFRH